MSCLNFRHHMSCAGHKCLQVLGIEPTPPKRKILEISAPFDFKAGPSVAIPGFSESEISLMKEKAIASTAMASSSSASSSEAEYMDFTTFSPSSSTPSSRRNSQYPLCHSRAGSHSSIRKRVVEHARKVSRTHFH